MNKERFLFSEEEMASMVTTSRTILTATATDGLGVLHHRLCQSLSFTGAYEMPVVSATNCTPPRHIAALYRLRGEVRPGCVPHFYTCEAHNTPVWNTPWRWLPTLLRYGITLSTDFSVNNELLLPQKMWNVFRNKLLAAWWQYCGVTVIANVSWPQGLDYKASFDGWPRHSLIAVNSTGLGRDTACRRSWLEGYRVMLDTLQPTHILRYGAKVEGESEDISTFYPNDNQTFARYGR